MKTNAVVKRTTDGEWINVLGMQLKFLCTNADTSGRYSTMLNTVPKGLGAPPHKHPWDEGFYVIKGKVELLLENTCHELAAGDYILVPANHVHAFKGLSEEEGLLIAFESPSHSREFFQEISETISKMPDDLEKMLDIGNRHQVTFVPI